MVVQHNLTAMNSNRMLGLTTSTQAKSTEKLSSGYKINRAADDAAGLSISEKMRKQIRGLSQASANAQDGISAVQTAEGALSEVQDMLQRMNELAVKAANGTMSETDRSYVQNEVDQLVTEIDRVAETTKFNETYLLKGDNDAVKEYTYSYKTSANGKAATTTFGAAPDNVKQQAGNNASIEVTFEASASAKDQNAVAKLIQDQGVSISHHGMKDQNTKATEDEIKATATSTYIVADLMLNGTSEYNAVADASNGKTADNSGTGDKFAVYNKTGDKIATITLKATNLDKAAAAEDQSAFAALKLSVTAESTTAGVGKGEKMAYYDRNGNKISENALANYFTTTKEGTTDKVAVKGDAPKVYDALGNETTLNIEDVESRQDLQGALSLKLHVGADATGNNQISLELQGMSAKSLGVAGLKVDGTDDKNALDAIETIKEAIQKVSTQRSALGAVQNRLEHTISNLDNVVENTTSAESQIRDTDMATEMVKYSNNNILAQAGQAMLAQANQSNQGVLSLLS